ncbi:hypothetical protein J6590_021388 [Homalodisca vitripennis]|nr:hypothetical protein J6590_021388 [Homalodisca vitripennis]
MLRLRVRPIQLSDRTCIGDERKMTFVKIAHSPSGMMGLFADFPRRKCGPNVSAGLNEKGDRR